MKKKAFINTPDRSYIIFKKLVAIKKSYNLKQDIRRKFLNNNVDCLKFYRYKMGLPCNGQRTQTNSGTCKLRRQYNLLLSLNEIKRLFIKINKK